MFVRKKQVKGNPYGYLVENEWTKKGSRQKVVAYLGRVHEFETGPEKSFPELEAIDLLEAIISYEVPDNIDVDMKECSVTCEDKAIAVGINEGVFCSHTLQEVLDAIKIIHEDRPGISLACAMRNAGLRISQEDFIRLYVSTRP